MNENNSVKRVYIELTNKCNLACHFCKKTQRKPSDLDIDTVEKIIWQSKTITEYIYLHVQGEPLIYAHLKEVFNITEKHQRKVMLVTNGTLLEKNKELLLNSKSLHKISISLQSLFLADNLSQKLNELEEFIKSAKKHNITIELRLWSDNDPLIMQYIQNSFYPLAKYGINAKISEKLYLSFQKQFKWPTINQDILRTSNCIGPKIMLCVLSDGTITPCCLDIDGKLSLGNIKDISLLEALKSDRYKRIIQGFNDNKVIELLCQSCDYGDNYE